MESGLTAWDHSTSSADTSASRPVLSSSESKQYITGLQSNLLLFAYGQVNN